MLVAWLLGLPFFGNLWRAGITFLAHNPIVYDPHDIFFMGRFGDEPMVLPIVTSLKREEQPIAY